MNLNRILIDAKEKERAINKINFCDPKKYYMTFCIKYNTKECVGTCKYANQQRQKNETK